MSPSREYQIAMWAMGCWLMLGGGAWAQAGNARPTSRPAATTKPVSATPSAAIKAPAKPLDAGAQLRKRVVEVRLPNGMLFLLVRRTGAPVFSAYIRVKVGGVDENNGLTGIAHIFEHMAFKGTTVVGPKQWDKEKVVLEQLSRTGDALSMAMVRSQGKETPEIQLLKRRLKLLQEKHKQLVETDEFTRIYQTNGGVGLNATTGKDVTSYFMSLPANRLELWARQEASRLSSPVFREFYRERSVVAEERRMAMSRGNGRLYEQFIATAFTAHPYRFPTVGWMSDITTIPISEVRKFFLAYYSPSNMVGTIVGNISIKETRALLLRTFGKIPPGPPPPPVRTVEPKQDGERRVTVRFHTNPQLMIGFHKPTAPHPHDDVFDVIEALLTDGPSSRLYRALVKAKMAQSVWASSLPGARFANVFTLGVTPIAPHSTEDIEKIIYRELERLKTEPVPAKELQKVRNKIAMSFLRSLRSNLGLAEQLSYFQSIVGDWRYATQHNRRLYGVTPALIMEVAKRYFRKANRTVATLVKHAPKASKAAVNPFGGRGPRATATAKDASAAKADPAAQRQALIQEFRSTVMQLRSMRKNVKTPAQRKAFAALVARARKLMQQIRSMRKPRMGRPQSAKKSGAPRANPQQLAVLARVKKLLAQTPVTPTTIRPLPKGLRAHPRNLKYPPLQFRPPVPTIVRLKNGMVLYLLEDHELPLIDIFAMIKTGRLYDPKDKVGLAEIAGRVMRTGGFGKYGGDQLDELLAFRAAQLSSRIDAENGLATLSIHRKDLQWGLGLLHDMLRFPRFPKDKINLERVRMMERHRRYQDEPFRLGIYHFRRLVYGANHRLAQKPTPRSIVSIKRDDLIAFHKKYYHPNNIRFAIVGDFSTPALLKQLKATFGDWQAVPTTYPKIESAPTRVQPTIALISQPIEQSIIIVGHLGPRRHEPQLLAGQVMNHILGGGGFSSRLMTEIRTRRGLAYFAGSQLVEGTDRGLFAAYTGTQPSSTGKTLKALLQQLKQMATKGDIALGELQLTRNTFLNQFVFRFQSASQIVFRQAYFDYFGYPKNHLETYRPRLVALTPKTLQQAAKSYIKPEQFVILVIGNEKQFDMPLSQFGKVVRISLE